MNAFYPKDILVGPSEVCIRALMAAVMLALKEHMQKLCNAFASIALIKDATLRGKQNLLIGS